MLQALGIALHPMLNVFRAAIAIQSDLLGKMLEINFVALAAPVETEKQDNRTMHDRSEQDRTGRKYSRCTPDLTLHCVVFSPLGTRSPNMPTRKPASRLSLTLSRVSGPSGTITVPAILLLSASKKPVLFCFCNVSIKTLSGKFCWVIPSARNPSKLPKCEPKRMQPLPLSIFWSRISFS